MGKNTLTRLFFSLIYGCILHGIAWQFLKTDRPASPPLPKQSIPVSIRFQSQTQALAPSKNPVPQPESLWLLVKSKESEPASKSDSLNHSKKQQQIPGSATQENRNYDSMLPKPSELSGDISIPQAASGGISSSKHTWSKGLGKEGKGSLLQNAGTLFANLDIPLTARSRLDSGKATARLSYDRDANIMTLRILQGQPILRAVLFDFISEEANQDTIRRIFKILDLRELTLALHTVDGSHLKANDDPFTWRENRLDLYVTKGSNGFSNRKLRWDSDSMSLSLPLPDEKADRAKTIDEAKYTTLQESPAYSHILSNRVLGK